MNREDLEHIIRAAAEITNEYEFVVIGSQSILGVGPETACLPKGWQDRLQRIQNSGPNGRVAYCLDVVERHLMVLVSDMPVDQETQNSLRSRIKRWIKVLREQGHEV